MGLPCCNMNSKLQIPGKRKDLTIKRGTETHFRQTYHATYNSKDIIFALVYLKLLVQIASLFAIK